MRILSPQKRGPAAFSLIEVTIAMAIAAVAVVSLLGLIPAGMNTMRDAGDEAIMARIHQQILNELQVADFDTLDTSYDDLEVYFDSQGEELGDNRGSGSPKKGGFEHIYSARVTVPKSGDRLPDSVGNGSFSGFSFDKGDTETDLLRPVIIEVAAVGGLGSTFNWGEKYRSMIKTYQTSVVKMGHAFSTTKP